MRNQIHQCNRGRRKWLGAFIAAPLAACGASVDEQPESCVSAILASCGQPMCTGSITAGQSGVNIGFANVLSIGSISGQPNLRGIQIYNLFDDGTSNELVFQLNASGNTTQSFFTALCINGTVYKSSDATFTEFGLWKWSPKTGFVNGTTYNFVIT